MQASAGPSSDSPPEASCSSDPSAVPLYRPQGKWEWLNGEPIRDSCPVSFLSSNDVFTVSLKTGVAGNQRIHYLSKASTSYGYWDGFLRELCLYKDHMKKLQGDVVPYILGVYNDTGRISIAMEAPDSSSWVTASPTMTSELKERCLEAVAKLHACGVEHGDLRLDNILIGGEGEVKMINFHRSRALRPRACVGLAAASPADLHLEMERLKGELDYQPRPVKLLRFIQGDRMELPPKIPTPPPHPPSLSTREEIVEANIERCAQLGLPHPDALRRYPDSHHWRKPTVLAYIRHHNANVRCVDFLRRRFPDRQFKLPRPKRSEGSLKRAIATIVLVPDSTEPDLPSGKRKREATPFIAEARHKRQKLLPDILTRHLPMGSVVSAPTPPITPSMQAPRTACRHDIERGDDDRVIVSEPVPTNTGWQLDLHSTVAPVYSRLFSRWKGNFVDMLYH